MCEQKADRFSGAVIGLALGDAFGAPYEGGFLERALWRAIGWQSGRRRWTDDTQMTIDVMESLLAYGYVNQDDLALRFAKSYRWSRGYGPGAARVLKRIRRGDYWESAARSVYRDGSYGNGGAMRTPAVGLFFAAAPEDELIAAAATAAVTHAHPRGREGAVLIALAAALAYKDRSSEDIIARLCGAVTSPEFLQKLHQARNWLETESSVDPREVASKLGNGIAAVESCVTAVYLALAFRSRAFEELLGFVIGLRGDVDTIAAMACSIWGAARGFGELPRARLNQLEQYERLKDLAQALAATARKNSQDSVES